MANAVTLSQLRSAIPAYCFRPSDRTSATYIVRDLFLACVLAASALALAPNLEHWGLRWSLWILYGYIQGLVFTGIWILAHECGHGALFSRKGVNDIFGFALHSLLLVPYFSWKYTHARHHMYTNHMERDTAFVPRRSASPSNKRSEKKSAWVRLLDVMREHDAPALAVMLLIHQLAGWPSYLLFYASGGSRSGPGRSPLTTHIHSHFDPTSRLFSKSERPFVLLSAVGLVGVFWILYSLGCVYGVSTILLLYGIPYLWVNNWLVAITYLHHTHPMVPHYENSSWTYLDGALGTVDRPFGFVGRHLFHGIIDCHVIHHLFPRIPFYHADDATAAIRPILGDKYLKDDTHFWKALWLTFRSCQAVQACSNEPDVLEWNCPKRQLAQP